MATFWSSLFALLGLGSCYTLEHRVFPNLVHAPWRGALPVFGLVAGLAICETLREAEWLPGLRRDRQDLLARIGAACLWFLLLLAAGMLVLPGLASLVLHKNMFSNQRFDGLGGAAGIDAFMFGICFALLPGARRAPGAPQPFGLAQGIFGIVAFGAMLAAGALTVQLVLVLEDLLLTATHHAARVNFNAMPVLAETILAGEFLAALWVVWYARQLGSARLRDGGVSGIAWAPAGPRAYVAATSCAAAIIVLVMVIYHLVPPDLTALDDLPIAKLFNGPAWIQLPVLGLLVLLAPLLEEFTFRGIAFGGIAARLGPVWAGVITTILFMAVHFPEKEHYLPGFIDVGLMASASCWLRVKFASIRPGILLHILYNGGLTLAAGLAH